MLNKLRTNQLSRKRELSFFCKEKTSIESKEEIIWVGEDETENSKPASAIDINSLLAPLLIYIIGQPLSIASASHSTERFKPKIRLLKLKKSSGIINIRVKRGLIKNTKTSKIKLIRKLIKIRKILNFTSNK